MPAVAWRPLTLDVDFKPPSLFYSFGLVEVILL